MTKSMPTERDYSTRSTNPIHLIRKMFLGNKNARKSSTPDSLGMNTIRSLARSEKESKIKYGLASIIESIVIHYQINIYVFLYCLEIVTKMNFQQEKLEFISMFTDEIGTAIIDFGARVFREDSVFKKKNIPKILTKINVAIKQEMLGQVQNVASGININRIFKLGPTNARRQILLKSLQINKQELYPQINFRNRHDFEQTDTKSTSSTEMDEQYSDFGLDEEYMDEEPTSEMDEEFRSEMEDETESEWSLY